MWQTPLYKVKRIHLIDFVDHARVQNKNSMTGIKINNWISRLLHKLSMKIK